ncbi:hypothetical protein BSLG_009224 [Batrachochytrium salamandrivorans]|nr:hypothetical protein BSLG_009224 [Batrachochytrium salamandrivorans]
MTMDQVATRRCKRMAEGDNDDETGHMFDGINTSLQKMVLRSDASKLRVQARRSIKTHYSQPDVMASAAENPSNVSVAHFNLADDDDDEENDATYESASNDEASEDTCTEADTSMGLDLEDDVTALHEVNTSASIGAQDIVYSNLNDPPKETADSDGASDYCPSDIDSMETFSSRRDLIVHRASKYHERAQSTFANLCRVHYTFPMTPPTSYLVAKLSKYNLEKRRWADKGPVLVYFLEGQPTRLVSNYLYGSRSVAFNIQIFETLEKFFNLSGARITINTQGYNTVSKAYIQTEAVPLESYFPGQISHGSLPIYKCDSIIVPENEQMPSLISLRFRSSKVAESITQTISHLVGSCRAAAIAQRSATFAQPLPVIGHPMGATSISFYSAHGEFTNKLAASGLYYYPQYNKMTNTVDDFTKCVWCGTEIPPFSSPECDVDAIHGEGSLHGVSTALMWD